MVRAHPWPTQTETTGDGSLVLTYESGHRCYFREVEPDGAVTGWLRRTHSTCPSLLRLDSGLLGSDSWDFTDPVDLSAPPREVPVVLDQNEKPRAGDTFLGARESGRLLCSLLGTGGAESPEADGPRGCAYSPRSHSLCNLTPEWRPRRRSARAGLGRRSPQHGDCDGWVEALGEFAVAGYP